MSFAAWLWCEERTKYVKKKKSKDVHIIKLKWSYDHLTSTSAMKASSGSSSLSEPPPDFICCRVGEFSAGIYGRSMLLLDSSSSSSKYLGDKIVKHNELYHSDPTIPIKHLRFSLRFNVNLFIKWTHSMCVYSRIFLIKIRSLGPYLVKWWKLLVLPVSSTWSWAFEWCVRILGKARFLLFACKGKPSKPKTSLDTLTAFVPIHDCAVNRNGIEKANINLHFLVLTFFNRGLCMILLMTVVMPNEPHEILKPTIKSNALNKKLFSF